MDGGYSCSQTTSASDLVAMMLSSTNIVYSKFSDLSKENWLILLVIANCCFLFSGFNQI